MNNDLFGFNNLDDILNDPFFRDAFNNGNSRMTINGQPVSKDQLRQMQANNGQQPVRQQQTKSNHPLLDEYGTDMTQMAKDGDLDPVIGRDNEIEQMEEVLSRRSKNNPVLIGEAGVGKTAVVEGLAQKIVDG